VKGCDKKLNYFSETSILHQQQISQRKEEIYEGKTLSDPASKGGLRRPGVEGRAIGYGEKQRLRLYRGIRRHPHSKDSARRGGSGR